MTVNPVLDIDQYPLPRPEDLFATLADGIYFSTHWIYHMNTIRSFYIDDEVHQFLTINTHCGLYCYPRLPFGVASAPSIFQKRMDQFLHGLDGVICYLINILVSGKTEADHLENLQKVLKTLQRYGVRAKKSKCSFLQKSV